MSQDVWVRVPLLSLQIDSGWLYYLKLRKNSLDKWNIDNMSTYSNYKEQMADWIAKHPEATIEEAWESGYNCSTEAWCRGKREKMERVCELIKDIIDK